MQKVSSTVLYDTKVTQNKQGKGVVVDAIIRNSRNTKITVAVLERQNIHQNVKCDTLSNVASPVLENGQILPIIVWLKYIAI